MRRTVTIPAWVYWLGMAIMVAGGVMNVLQAIALHS